jgi:hypothetical protein
VAQEPYTPYPTVSPGPAGGQPMDIRANPEMFGGLIGGAEQRFGAQSEQAGGNLMDVAVMQQQRTNEVATDDAYNKLQKGYYDLTYGKPGQPGFYGLRGQDAMAALQPTAQSMDQLREQLKQGLPSDAARLKFEESSRRLQMITLDTMGRHYDTQFNSYSLAVHKASEDNAAQSAAANYNDEGHYQESLQKAREGAVKAVQVQYGMNADPQLIDDAVNKATTNMVRSRALAWGANDPTAALGWLQTQEKDVAPAVYQQLYDHLKGKANGAEDDSYVSGLLGGLPGGSRTPGGGAAPRAGVTPSTVFNALVGTEASGPSAVSPKGATGTAQIIESTFNQYKLPGESYSNEDDRRAAARRAVDDLWKKYPNDPERVAVGYFSGPGNIAPPGSPTPWKEDKSDGISTTSGYVSRFTSKLGVQPSAGPRLATVGGVQVAGPGGATTAQPIPTGAEPSQQQSAYPDESALIQQVIRDNPDPERRAARLSKLTHQLSILHLATQTDRNDLERSLPDLQAAALDGQDVTIPEDRIRQLIPPAEAAQKIEALNIAKQAGLVLKGIQWGSPDDVQAAWNDLSSGMGPISAMIRQKGKTSMGPVAPAEEGSDKDTPEAYRLRQSILRSFEQQIGARGQMLSKDPARYAAGSPTVSAAAATLQAAGNDPAKAGPAAQAYVNATLTVQEHLGVPESAQHVLPEAQATDLATKIMAPGVDVQMQLRNLANQWGDAWPKVFSDLVTLGKLPGQYQSVAALDDPREAALLARSIAETSKGGRDWNDILGNAGGKPVAQGIRDAVRNDTTVMQLERSLSRSGSSAQQIDGILSSIETLAYGKRFFNQDGNAAQSAIKAFTDRYTFMENGGARVPTEKADAVRANARDLIDGLTADQIKVPELFTATPDERSKMPSAPTSDDYLHSLKANPTWITSPREDALWLMDGGGRVVRGQNGKPIAIPFEKPEPTQTRLRVDTGNLVPGLGMP